MDKQSSLLSSLLRLDSVVRYTLNGRSHTVGVGPGSILLVVHTFYEEHNEKRLDHRPNVTATRRSRHTWEASEVPMNEAP